MKHSKRTTVTSTQDEVSQEAAASREQLICEQAYTLYEARGRVDGYALEDWLEAEARVARAIHAAALARTGSTADHEAA